MTDVPDGLLRQLARVRFRGVGCSRHRLAVDSRSQPEVCPAAVERDQSAETRVMRSELPTLRRRSVGLGRDGGTSAR